jgi:hypothetical protein
MGSICSDDDVEMMEVSLGDVGVGILSDGFGLKDEEREDSQALEVRSVDATRHYCLNNTKEKSARCNLIQ